MADSDNNVALCVDSRLHHFLYLGTEGNIWKPEDLSITPSVISSLSKLIDEGRISAEVVAHFHTEGWFVNPESIYFALALAAHSDNLIIKHAAFSVASEVCKSSTALLSFVYFMEKICAPKTGWGRAMRHFVSHWYASKDAKQLAVEVTKVISAHRWCHKDVLCLAHVKATKPDTAAVLKYIVKGLEAAEREYGTVPEAQDVLTYLKAVHELKHTTDDHTAARLIEMHDLSFEHIPTKLLKSKEIWTCLIPRLKLQKLLHQLPNLHKLGLLKLNSLHLKAVLERLRDENALTDGDIGPLETFLPIRQWEAANRVMPGRPLIRQNTPQLDEALLNLHLASFNVVPSTGKRYLVAVDVRGSMVNTHAVGCSCVSPADVSAIVLMALVKAEASNVTALAFSSSELTSIDVNNKMSLSDIAQRMRNVPMGPVNLAAPVQWAMEKKKAFDIIIVFTDNHTSIGDVHPAVVLKEYQSSMNLPNTRFITCALCSREFTVAPPAETGMLDIAGFHVKLLQVIQDFARRVF